MREALLEKIEGVLSERVRPQLRGHSGDLEVSEVRDGVLYVRFLGKCHGCPSASLTLESLVSEEVMSAVPEISRVSLITGVSAETWDMAREILARRRADRDAGE